MPFPTFASDFKGPGLSNVRSLEFYWSHGMECVDRFPEALFASPVLPKLESVAVSTTRLGMILEGLKRLKRPIKVLTFKRSFQLHHAVEVTLNDALEPTAIHVRPTIDGPVTLEKIESTDPFIEALQSLPSRPNVTFDPRITVKDDNGVLASLLAS